MGVSDEIEGPDYLIIRISWHSLDPDKQPDFLFFCQQMGRRYMSRKDRWFTIWKVLT